jgi:hypothetical protein
LELRQRALRQSLQTHRRNLLASAWAGKFADRADALEYEDAAADEDADFREQLAELQQDIPHFSLVVIAACRRHGQRQEPADIISHSDRYKVRWGRRP